MASAAFGMSNCEKPNQSVAQYIIPNRSAICCCGSTLTSSAVPNSPCPYATGLSNWWFSNAVRPTLQMKLAW